MTDSYKAIVSAIASIVTSLGLVANEVMTYLNANGVAFGVLFGGITTTSTVYFHIKNNHTIAKSHIERRAAERGEL
ncbi:hypothetical protein [Methylomonas sp. AM2-LC]|uniref:hypothetical protein n=1 Tax=Methylomonas sp. AM2-LC TaxID=3153301 RepID=UPI003262CF89